MDFVPLFCKGTIPLTADQSKYVPNLLNKVCL